MSFVFSISHCHRSLHQSNSQFCRSSRRRKLKNSSATKFVKRRLRPRDNFYGIVNKTVVFAGSLLLGAGYSTKLDASNEAIGRRYARTDEVGICFGVTVDTQSEVDRTVTLRERDSMAQVRLSIDGLLPVAHALMRGDKWSDVVARFQLPPFNG